MKKTDKKHEKLIVEALTEVCDIALSQVPGFQWLTHLINYSRFPDSLKVVCVFATKDDLNRVLLAKQDDFLRSLIREKLSAVAIPMKDTVRQVNFDSEEACELEDGGKWQYRLR